VLHIHFSVIYTITPHFAGIDTVTSHILEFEELVANINSQF